MKQTNTLQKSIAHLILGDLFTPWHDGVPTILTQEQWTEVCTNEEQEDAIADVLCDIVGWTLDFAGVDNILSKIPADWQLTVDAGDNPTKETFAWYWLWEQLINVQEVNNA